MTDEEKDKGWSTRKIHLTKEALFVTAVFATNPQPIVLCGG